MVVIVEVVLFAEVAGNPGVGVVRSLFGRIGSGEEVEFAGTGGVVF